MNNFFRTSSFKSDTIDELDRKKLAKHLGHNLNDASISDDIRTTFFKYYKYHKDESDIVNDRQITAFFGLCLYCYLNVNTDEGERKITDSILSILKDKSISDTKHDTLESIMTSNKMNTPCDVTRCLGTVIRSLPNPEKHLYSLDFNNMLWDIMSMSDPEERRKTKIKWTRLIYNLMEVEPNEE